MFLLNRNKGNTKVMRITIPQVSNKKLTRNDHANAVAKIEKVDVSYVRKIINGTYKPKSDLAKEKATRIKQAYKKMGVGTRQLIKNIKKEVRA